MKETKTPKKTTKKVVEKKAVVKKETKEVEKKLVLNQEKALALTLVILAVLVVILLVIALVQKNRSKDIENYPVNEIALSLGGGGHKNASGATITDKTSEEVANYFVNYFQNKE
jgi:nanoRNase/pAp phosphatase (c-di-AMP/oligoRNAs hydrolase)